jgi:hypothetical protein
MSLAHLLDPGPVHAITWALHLRRFEKIKRSPVSKVKFWFTISLVWEIVRIPNVFNIPASVIHCNHQKGAKRVLLKSQIPRGTSGSKISTPFLPTISHKDPQRKESHPGVSKNMIPRNPRAFRRIYEYVPTLFMILIVQTLFPNHGKTYTVIEK